MIKVLVFGFACIGLCGSALAQNATVVPDGRGGWVVTTPPQGAASQFDALPGTRYVPPSTTYVQPNGYGGYNVTPQRRSGMFDQF
jgi:hypothetical protein